MPQNLGKIGLIYSIITIYLGLFSFDTARLDTLQWEKYQGTTSEERLNQTSGHLLRDYVMIIGDYLGCLYVSQEEHLIKKLGKISILELL